MILFDTSFAVGIFVGALLMGALAVFVAVSYSRYLKLHARREWRSPVLIAGEQFYLVPNVEYIQLDAIRAKTLAALQAGRAAGALGSYREPWRDRADHDLSPRGGTLRRGARRRAPE